MADHLQNERAAIIENERSVVNPSPGAEMCVQKCARLRCANWYLRGLIHPALAVDRKTLRSTGRDDRFFGDVHTDVQKGCRGFLELSGSVAHELSAFSASVGKRRRA